MSEDSPRPAQIRTSPRILIIDADAHGAVVLDESAPAALGIRRNGSIAWRVPMDQGTPVPVGCLARCPDAVLSGSGASINSPTVSDPDPVFIRDGRRETLDGLQGPKRQVLTARSAGDFVLATGDRAGRWRLELHHRGSVDRVSVGGHRTFWREDADRRYALAVTHVQGGNEARWFARRNERWRLLGAANRTIAGASCVRPDGAQALLIGRTPAVIDHAGVQTPITDLRHAGTCAWSAEGGIVAALALTPRGPYSALRTFDRAGKVTWRLETRTEVTVTADPTSPRVAYTVLDVLHEIDPRSGNEVRTLPRVRSARYDRDGRLVVAGSDGTLEWLPRIGAPKGSVAGSG